MNEVQIKKLVIESEEETVKKVKMLETHASWVLFSKKYVYKIKKPVKTSFLDYSTLKKRQYYCQQELEINNRYSKNIYLEVVEVKEYKNKIIIGIDKGTTIDYAVKMKKLSSTNLLSQMLVDGTVTEEDIRILGSKICEIHINSEIVHPELDGQKMFLLFKDLLSVKDIVEKNFDPIYLKLLLHCVGVAEPYLQKNNELIIKRVEELFVRDCHGDLHSANIFIYKTPILYDAIDFSDRYRQIDVLSDLAFLIMDLEYHGRKDLADVILKEYLKKFKAIRNDEERKLFSYYKMYRANVRVKVLCLQLEKSTDLQIKDKVMKYLNLIGEYLKDLE